jgi:AraC family transcriptional regulator
LFIRRGYEHSQPVLLDQPLPQKGLSHCEPRAQKADGPEPGLVGRAPCRIGYVNERDRNSRLNSVGDAVHRIGAQYNAICAGGVQSPRGVLQDPGGVIPLIIVLGPLDGSEIDAKEDQRRGSQRAETATNRLVSAIRKFQVRTDIPVSRSPVRRVTRMSGAVVLELHPAAPYSGSDPRNVQSLGIALERQRGVHAIGSDVRVDFDVWPGVLACTPPGIDVFSESPVGGEYLVARWEGADAAPLARRIELAGHRAAATLGQRIRHALLSSHPDPLALEQLTLQFIGLRPHSSSVRALLSRAAVRNALDRISDEYARPLTLADLAALANQTPLQFLREFTRAVGMTPHAFITETRLQASRRMLEHSDAPLATIATECGFSHQSHMGSAFRRMLGMTPGEYRRVHRRT